MTILEKRRDLLTLHVLYAFISRVNFFSKGLRTLIRSFTKKMNQKYKLK